MRSFQDDKLPLPSEIVPKDFFNVHSHIDLEIGSGTGDFALQYTHNHPERFLIAIERTHNKFNTFKNKLDQQKNLLALHADARSVVVHCIPPNSLEKIFLLYPNPYPKKKQANQRWHNMPFFNFLLTRLKPSGELHFATNIEDYYSEFLQSTAAFGLSVIKVESLTETSVPRTAFEKKYLLRGETCWNITCKKPPL